MLALSRKCEQAIVLDNGVRIEVIKVSGTRVVLGVHAPAEVTILREELVGKDFPRKQADSERAVVKQPPSQTRALATLRSHDEPCLATLPR